MRNYILCCKDKILCDRESIFDSVITKKDVKMAKLLQVKLPPEMDAMFADIKAERAKKFEPLSNTSIVIDAIKEMHSRIQEQQ